MNTLFPRCHPKKLNWRLLYEPYYRGYPVCYKGLHHSPLIGNQLERLYDVVNRARYNQSRTLALRFDLYLPNDAALSDFDYGSHRLKDFWAYFNGELSRARLAHHPNLEFAWAREIGSVANKTHFHVLLLLNAHAIIALGNPGPSYDSTFSDNTLAHRIIRSWLAALNYPPHAQYGDLIHFQKDYYSGALLLHTLHQADEHGWSNLFYLASYFCKSGTKPVQERLRTFDVSRDYSGRNSSL